MSSEARMVERPSRAPPTYSAAAIAPSGANDAQDWGATQVCEWLMLLLRFAVTSDAKDQSAALTLADEIDARGLQWRPSAPTFFRRTTKEVCRAIITHDDPRRTGILRRHVARIDNPVLKRTFRAAVNIDERTASSEHKARDLWFGLRR